MNLALLRVLQLVSLEEPLRMLENPTTRGFPVIITLFCRTLQSTLNDSAHVDKGSSILAF